MNNPPLSRDRITTFLESLGKALSSGDVKAIPSFWGVPSLVLSDILPVGLSVTVEK